MAEQGLAGLPSQAASLRPALPWVVRATCVLAGAAAGWLAGRTLNFLLGWFFAKFNAGFEHTANGYTRLVGRSLGEPVGVLALAVAAAGGWLGWELLGPHVGVVAELAAVAVASAAEFLQTALPWVGGGLAGLAGAVVGGLAWRTVDRSLRWFFVRNQGRFRYAANLHTRVTGVSLRACVIVLLVYLGMLRLTHWSFQETPRALSHRRTWAT